MRPQIIIKSKSVSSVSHPNALFQSSPRKITGQVKDALGEPIIGANVVVKGTTNGTITDMDGKFSLNVEKGATLVISYIGFSNQEIKIGNQTNLSITMKEDSEALDEVIVVGYGTQKKVNLTGSVATISSKDIAETHASNTSTLLAGRLPGVISMAVISSSLLYVT